jgi:hypothetical protein
MCRARVVLVTTVAGLVVAAVLAGTVAPPATASQECADASGCSTTAGPWVVVPPQPNVGAVDQITATWGANCTGFLIGSDWNVPAGVKAYRTFNMWIGVAPGVRLYRDYSGVVWGAENLTSRPQTFQPLLGCSDQPPSGTARAAATSPPPRVVRRIATMPLGPNRSRNFSSGCRHGETMVASGHAVAFYTKRPPSSREMGEILSTRVQGRRSVRVHITTGPHVGDNERVRIQIHCDCRRA